MNNPLSLAKEDEIVVGAEEVDNEVVVGEDQDKDTDNESKSRKRASNIERLSYLRNQTKRSPTKRRLTGSEPDNANGKRPRLSIYSEVSEGDIVNEVVVAEDTEVDTV